MGVSPGARGYTNPGIALNNFIISIALRLYNFFMNFLADLYSIYNPID
jgi:hypothetical protein